MGKRGVYLILTLVMLFLACSHNGHVAGGGGGLEYGFYSKTCPRAEHIVKDQVTKLYHQHGNTAVSWLRNLFHDCAVGGCDGSLLLDPVPGGPPSEKSATKNFGMRNYKYVDTIKAAVEKECVGTVSCADIVVLSARDGIAMLGGPRIRVKTGRRDSRRSEREAAEKQLFETDIDVPALLARFKRFGLNTAQSVALLGAHSVGRTHCVNLVKRLYPDVDPQLNPSYALYLKMRCPSPKPDPRAVKYARNDQNTPMKLDNEYFKNAIDGKGLLSVDHSLSIHPLTAPYVHQYAENNAIFFTRFSEAVLVLSDYRPLTSPQGEIRHHCRFVNSA